MTLPAAALSGRARIRNATVLASAVAVACFGAAGAARADSTPAGAAGNVKPVVVVIGANERIAPMRSSHISPKRAYVRGP